MQTETTPYQWFVGGYFSELTLVRNFGLWQVWAAQQGRVPLLLVVNEVEEVVIRCQYESSEERFKEINLVRRIPPEGEAGAGVLAFLGPVPPVISAGNARSLPKPGSGTGPPAT